MSYNIDATVCSNVGKIRKNNEDNFFFNGVYMDETKRDSGGLFSRNFVDGTQIFAVCDGMGGADAGEDASIAAVRALKEYAKTEQRVDDPQLLKDEMQRISDTIEHNAQMKNCQSGTTIAMVVICDGAMRTVHVGDSRVYCMRNGELKRLTEDHSEVQRMLKAGIITADQIDTHPKRHMITQFLGMPRAEGLVSPGISEREPLKKGMRLLICSDGLTDMVKDPEITRILAGAANAEAAAKQLTIAALQNGGKDNVTVICLYVGEKSGGGTDKMKKLKRNYWLSIAGLALSGVTFLVSLAMVLTELL